MQKVLDIYSSSKFHEAVRHAYGMGGLRVDNFIMAGNANDDLRIMNMLREVDTLVDPADFIVSSSRCVGFADCNKVLYDAFYDHDVFEDEARKVKCLDTEKVYFMVDGKLRETSYERPHPTDAPLRPTIGWFSIAFDVEGVGLRQWMTFSDQIPDFVLKSYRRVKVRPGVVYSLTEDGAVEAKKGEPIPHALYIHKDDSCTYSFKNDLPADWYVIDDVYERIREDLAGLDDGMILEGYNLPFRGKPYTGRVGKLLNFKESISYFNAFEKYSVAKDDLESLGPTYDGFLETLDVLRAIP